MKKTLIFCISFALAAMIQAKPCIPLGEDSTKPADTADHHCISLSIGKTANKPSSAPKSDAPMYHGGLLLGVQHLTAGDRSVKPSSGKRANTCDLFGCSFQLGFTEQAGLVRGCAGSLLTNDITRVQGVQGALGFNDAYDVTGAQVTLIKNTCVTRIRGVQFGIWNEADDLHGVQIGIVNFDNRGTIKFFPFVNIGW